jgi:glycine cleavage system regulatory protein
MKSIFISTVLGPHTPGIINAIAKTTRGLGGEWATSKTVKLDGQFTAIMKVEIDSENENKLKTELEETYSQLQFFYAPALTTEKTPPKIVSLEIKCKDRPGLTKQITGVLHNLRVNVESMEFHRFLVLEMGGNVFSANLDIVLPESVTEENVADEIESISSDIRVRIL